MIGALEGQVCCHSGGQVIVRRGRVASLEMMFYFFQRVDHQHEKKTPLGSGLVLVGAFGFELLVDEAAF